VNAVRILGGDVDGAVGIDGDVHDSRMAAGAAVRNFAVAHSIGKENGHGAAAAVGYVDGGSSVDGQVHRCMFVRSS